MAIPFPINAKEARDYALKSRLQDSIEDELGKIYDHIKCESKIGNLKTEWTVSSEISSKGFELIIENLRMRRFRVHYKKNYLIEIDWRTPNGEQIISEL